MWKAYYKQIYKYRNSISNTLEIFHISLKFQSTYIFDPNYLDISMIVWAIFSGYNLYNSLNYTIIIF
jgi:hypothetical protein